jgi:hypothetical protein
MPINLSLLIPHINDANLLEIIKNQITIDNTYIDKLYNENRVKINYSINNFILTLSCEITPTNSKLNTFTYLINKLTVEKIKRLFENFKSLNILNKIDKIIINYLKKNYNDLIGNIKLSLELINIFIIKSNIVIEIYNIIKTYLNYDEKIEILNKCLTTLDINLILTILEDSDIKVNEDILINLPKNIKYHNLSSVKVAEIIDILEMYGLIITRKLILNLLDYRCYVSNILKYNIELDDEIEEKCALLHFYPYIFTKIPSNAVLNIECNKENNLVILTTIGQMNFFRWALNNDIIKYAFENYRIIIDKYSHVNSYFKKNLIENNSFSTSDENIDLSKSDGDLEIDTTNKTIEVIPKYKYPVISRNIFLEF